jgi:CheY-like chemotaxis protein
VKFAQKKQILIVDDEGISRKVLQAHLSYLGYRSRAFASVEELRKHLEKVGPEGVECIITDIMMPSLTGLDLLLELRQSEEFRDLPVIVVSGVRPSLYQEIFAALNVGCVLGKPFRLEHQGSFESLRRSLSAPGPRAGAHFQSETLVGCQGKRRSRRGYASSVLDLWG